MILLFVFTGNSLNTTYYIPHDIPLRDSGTPCNVTKLRVNTEKEPINNFVIKYCMIVNGEELCNAPNWTEVKCLVLKIKNLQVWPI